MYQFPSSPWQKYLNLTGKGILFATSERGLQAEFSYEVAQHFAHQLFRGVKEAES